MIIELIHGWVIDEGFEFSFCPGYLEELGHMCEQFDFGRYNDGSHAPRIVHAGGDEVDRPVVIWVSGDIINVASVGWGVNTEYRFCDPEFFLKLRSFLDEHCSVDS